MDILSISGLVNGISAVFFSFLFFRYRKKGFYYVIFFWMNIAVAVWGWSYFFWLQSTTYENARFWVAILSIAANFIPVLFFHWIVSFLSFNEKNKYVTRFGYFLSSFFSLFVFSSLYVKTLQPLLYFEYWPIAGPLYIYFIVIIYSGFSFYGAYILISVLLKSRGVEKTKIKYLLVGVVIGFGSGVSNFFLWYKIEIIPYLNFGVTIYICITIFNNRKNESVFYSDCDVQHAIYNSYSNTNN